MLAPKQMVQRLLQECCTKKDLVATRQVHSLMTNTDLLSDPALVVHLIRAFGFCESLVDADRVFRNSAARNGDVWIAIIFAHAKLGDCKRALSLYQEMQEEGLKPNKFISSWIVKTCTSLGLLGALQAIDIIEEYRLPVSKNILYCLLQGCLKTNDLEGARHVHSVMINAKLDCNDVLGNHLIRIFASCGKLQEATQVFRKVSKPTVYTFAAIISAYANQGEGNTALDLYYEMLQSGLEIIRAGLDSDVTIANTVVHMYAQGGSLKEAHMFFEKLPVQDLVSWAALIGGYAKHGHGFPALTLYKHMVHKGIMPCKVVHLSSLKACICLGALKEGRMIHHHIVKSSHIPDINIGSALVDMYAKCGSLEEAHKEFNCLPRRTVATWGAIIGGYAQHGDGFRALKLYGKMQDEYVEPNNPIFLSALKACGSIGAFQHGWLLHGQIIQSGIVVDVVLGSTIVDMYARCGRLQEALKVFDKLPDRNIVSWTAIIGGYARSGNLLETELLVNKMQEQGFKPDNVILSSILTAYSHAGLLNEGHWFFRAIIEEFGMIPTVSHFNCLVDLLCRCGCLEEAKDMIASMPVSPDLVGWKALLNGCRSLGNMELGRDCFDELVDMNPVDSVGYVLLSNICADADAWDEIQTLQSFKKFAAAMKKPGTAWIEVENQVHEFVVGQKALLQSAATESKFKRLTECIKVHGHVPLSSLIYQTLVSGTQVTRRPEYLNMSKGSLIEELEEHIQRLHEERATVVNERSADNEDENLEVEAALNAALSSLSKGVSTSAAAAANAQSMREGSDKKQRLMTLVETGIFKSRWKPNDVHRPKNVGGTCCQKESSLSCHHSC